MRDFAHPSRRTPTFLAADWLEKGPNSSSPNPYYRHARRSALAYRCRRTAHSTIIVTPLPANERAASCLPDRTRSLTWAWSWSVSQFLWEKREWPFAEHRLHSVSFAHPRSTGAAWGAGGLRAHRSDVDGQGDGQHHCRYWTMDRSTNFNIIDALGALGLQGHWKRRGVLQAHAPELTRCRHRLDALKLAQ